MSLLGVVLSPGRSLRGHPWVLFSHLPCKTHRTSLRDTDSGDFFFYPLKDTFSLPLIMVWMDTTSGDRIPGAFCSSSPVPVPWRLAPAEPLSGGHSAEQPVTCSVTIMFYYSFQKMTSHSAHSCL